MPEGLPATDRAKSASAQIQVTEGAPGNVPGDGTPSAAGDAASDAAVSAVVGGPAGPIEGPTPDPRESFRRFPAWVQPLITCISGRPLRGGAPLLRVTPVQTVLIDAAKYAAGVGAGAALLTAGGAWLLLLPLAWILTVNATRSLASDAHYGGHSALTMNKRIDRVLGDLISLSVLSANMDDYARRHNRDHHGKLGIWSRDDPDIGMIRTMGFEMGRSPAYYRWRQRLTLISPRYHCLSLHARLRTTFVTAPAWRMVTAWIAGAAILGLTAWTGRWDVLVFAWLVPLLPGFALSSALQFPSEHRWLEPKRPGESHQDYVFRVSWGRFFLVAAPPAGLGAADGAAAWARWSLAMLPMLFQRAFVCAVTLPAHDYHHRVARHRDWPMGLYGRERDRARGVVRYQDFYGLAEPTRRVFDTWSRLPADTLPRPRTTLACLEDLARTFDRTFGTRGMAHDA